MMLNSKVVFFGSNWQIQKRFDIDVTYLNEDAYIKYDKLIIVTSLDIYKYSDSFYRCHAYVPYNFTVNHRNDFSISYIDSIKNIFHIMWLLKN